MIEYKSDDISGELLLTLTENASVAEPVYVFTFTHVLTKQTVQFSKTSDDDESTFPERYNLFRINPSELFQQPGEWHYTVSEQQTGLVLERGKMNITKTFNFTMYDADTRYTTYGG
jgi:hypothetical protein